VDETYVKVAGRWGYVYRAIDEQGQVVEVLFQEHRDTEAATAFFRSALESTGVTPQVVTTDKAASYHPRWPKYSRRSSTSREKRCSRESSAITSI
jgi:transposase-like protein